MSTLYWYPNCSTCRKARKWLDEHGVSYELVDLVADPPGVAVLQQVLDRSGEPSKKLFNTSGQSYRNGGFKDRLPEMDDAARLEALAADGKLVKRPLFVTDERAIIGFSDARYQAFHSS